MLKIMRNGEPVEHSTLHFSGGELQPSIGSKPSVWADDEFVLTTHLGCSDDIMELILVVDAIRRVHGPGAAIGLGAPYLPYARQDRVCDEGQALSLKVMADLLNAQHFSEVAVWDVHSDVAGALINNIVNIPAAAFVAKLMPVLTDTVLVAPDAGAAKRTALCAKRLNKQMIQAEKQRDPHTGKITGTAVHADFNFTHQDFLMVDDICDGGRTFIELARKLRPMTSGKVNLYVTHGIFSQGLGVFEGLIDHIYCPNIFPNTPRSHILNEI